MNQELIPNDEPLVWTTKGNLPQSSLTYATRWEVTDDYVKFIEQHRLGDEVVRESCHVLAKKSMGDMLTETQSFQ